MIYLGIIAGLSGLDLWVKKSVREAEASGEGGKKHERRRFADLLEEKLGAELTLYENAGAAAGLFSGKRNLICSVGAGVLAWFAAQLCFLRRKKGVCLEGVGLSLLLGGGLGNFIDRFRKGTVTDYIRFKNCPVEVVRRLVFNLADFIIIIGAILYAISRIFSPKK